MKKFARNLVIAGAVLLAIGIAVFVIGMSAIDWDFARLDATEYTERVYEQPDGEEIKSVKIAVNSFGVVVKNGDRISLEYFETDESNTSVNIENGVLKINEKSKPGSWFTHGMFNFGFGRLDKKFVLTVPSGLPIDVKSTSAELDLHGVVTDSINADCTNLALKLSDCEFTNLRLHSTNLTLTAEDCKLGDIDLDSTNLTAKMTAVESGTVKMHSTNVTFKANGSNFVGATVTGTNINMNFDTVTCDDIYAKGTNNHCRFDGLTVNKVDIDGTNVTAVVKINGVQSEYTVITDGNRVDGTNPEKLLTFDGTNLKVELSFI